jgi:hypothetical protein
MGDVKKELKAEELEARIAPVAVPIAQPNTSAVDPSGTVEWAGGGSY